MSVFASIWRTPVKENSLTVERTKIMRLIHFVAVVVIIAISTCGCGNKLNPNDMKQMDRVGIAVLIVEKFAPMVFEAEFYKVYSVVPQSMREALVVSISEAVSESGQFASSIAPSTDRPVLSEINRSGMIGAMEELKWGKQNNLSAALKNEGIDYLLALAIQQMYVSNQVDGKLKVTVNAFAYMYETTTLDRLFFKPLPERSGMMSPVWVLLNLEGDIPDTCKKHQLPAISQRFDKLIDEDTLRADCGYNSIESQLIARLKPLIAYRFGNLLAD